MQVRGIYVPEMGRSRSGKSEAYVGTVWGTANNHSVEPKEGGKKPPQTGWEPLLPKDVW